MVSRLTFNFVKILLKSLGYIFYLMILTGKNCFIYFITRMVGWLVLTFLLCLHNQLSSIIRFHYHVLSVQMFEKCDSLNRQKMNGCYFKQVLRQNLGWFLS